MNPGIYRDVDINVYHANREIVSSTGLKFARKSTRDFIWYVMNGTEQTQTFDFGNAFEIALMDAVNGTNLFDQFVAVAPTEKWVNAALLGNPELSVPRSSKIYRECKNAFHEHESGKYIIPDFGSESMDWCDKMVKSCMANPTIKKLLSGSEYQVSLVWTDPDSGVKCKTRPDVCMSKKNVILDIKTTIDASPSGFAKQAANLDYPLQAIMQIQGCLHSGLMDSVDNYFWLAVEKSEPFNVGLYEFQRDDMEYMTDEYHFILKRCAEGLKRLYDFASVDDIYSYGSYGERSANPHGILSLEIPLWYKNQVI